MRVHGGRKGDRAEEGSEGRVVGVKVRVRGNKQGYS